MNIQHIRDRVTNGFKPFVIHLSDGRKFPVPHPEFVAVGKNVVVVIGKNDRVNMLDPIHITSVEGPLEHK
jgi:hypothetical protein